MAWFAKHRRVFVERCVGCVVDGELDERARCLALGVIMECARCETPGKFSNELYEDALRRATRAKSWSEALLGTLKARYLTRVDVRYHTYGAMRKLAEELKTYAPGEGEAAAVDVARNVYDVLNATPRAFDDYRGDEAGAEDEDGRADFAAMLAKLRGESVDDEGEKKRGPWCEDAEGSVIDLEAAKKKRKTSGGGKPKWTEGARHRRAFSDAWLALLRADFPEDIYRKILMRLHVDVMPHMVNPQLLSDVLQPFVRIARRIVLSRQSPSRFLLPHGCLLEIARVTGVLGGEFHQALCATGAVGAAGGRDGVRRIHS